MVLVNQCVDIDSKHYQLVVTNILYTMPITVPANCAAMAETVNRAKPSGEELDSLFRGHIAQGTLILTDGLRSYRVLEGLEECSVVDINHEKSRGIFNLNTVNSLHSYIKETYNHYRGVATKYINR